MESKRSYGTFCNEAMAGGNYGIRRLKCGGAKDIAETTSQLREKSQRMRKKMESWADVVEGVRQVCVSPPRPGVKVEPVQTVLFCASSRLLSSFLRDLSSSEIDMPYPLAYYP